MASNYNKICEENRQRYGTEGAVKSGSLAAGLYDDRTHFIFELLQNAEDALGRRGDWHGPRKVVFTLSSTHLALSHFGKPFDEGDVRSVCDIAESTKNESSIGRFGLGFKSVYTVTELPEIHSGDEDFAIEDYVFPRRADRAARAADETKIILPLRAEDTDAPKDITTGFRQLGPGALLFLRHIDEISWSVVGGASGFYLRNPPQALGPNVHRISLVGQESGLPEVDQNWLVFHRDVFSPEKKWVGRAEIAFRLVSVKEVPGRLSVQPLATAPLVVYFPTVVESHLGFLVQGPYRTTPSRETIPPGDPWNQHLVEETSSLLVEAMCWMRDNDLLDVSALRCLPLDREKFPSGSRFAPMFDAVRQAFIDVPLLPTFDDGHATAQQARLARTQDLRTLLKPKQVAALFGSEVTAWLSGDITQDRSPEVLKYLTVVLGIDLITPAKLIPSLSREFLEAQPDDWVLALYEFLSGQEAAVRRRLDTIPLIRLEDGTHVVAHEHGEAKAFLPSKIATGFPTVRRAVCATSVARAFLGTLGIAEPDPVDDVIRNVLPKYQQVEVDVDDDSYAADIERIRSAFGSDSAAQKEKLRSVLRDARFVKAVNMGDGLGYLAKPGEIYIATDRLRQLFADVPDILLVDDGFDCLRGEGIRDLLVACGASRYLALRSVPSKLGVAEKEQIRKENGLERASREDQLEDFTIRGLAQLLKFLPTLGTDEARTRAGVFWDALCDLESRGSASFFGSYRWGYSHETKTARFDAQFVRTLTQAAWVPDTNGELVPPGFIVFESLGWKPNPFILSRIAFKPPIIDQLAKAAGIDPAILDLLRRNPEAAAELVARLSSPTTPGVPDPPPDGEPPPSGSPGGDVYGDAKDLYGDDFPEIPGGSIDPDGGDNGPGRKGTGTGGRGDAGNGDGGGGPNDRTGKGTGKRSPGSTGGRPFFSYLGTHPDQQESDPDGLDDATRKQIEESGITLIIGIEPKLRRTQVGNRGFDLYEADSTGSPVRWVEVKAMTGSLKDRPVGLSRAQFDFASEKRAAYWLYVVENANNPRKARVLRIQDPATRARTFTFDHGWSQIAMIEAPE